MILLICVFVAIQAQEHHFCRKISLPYFYLKYYYIYILTAGLVVSQYSKFKIYSLSKCSIRASPITMSVFLNIISNCVSLITWHLFTELPRPGDSEETFRSTSQAATCLLVYHIPVWWRLGVTLSLLMLN